MTEPLCPADDLLFSFVALEGYLVGCGVGKGAEYVAETITEL